MSVKDSESGEGSSKDIKTGYTCTVNDKLKQKKLDLFLDPTVGAIACGVYQFDDNLITRYTSESEMSRWANVEQNQQKAILSQQDPSLVSCANGLVRTRSANRRMARVWRNVETKDN